MKLDLTATTILNWHYQTNRSRSFTPLARQTLRFNSHTHAVSLYLCWMFLERPGRAGPGNRVWPPEFRLHFSCKPKENTAPVSQARGALWELWPWLPFGSGVSVTWMRPLVSVCVWISDHFVLFSFWWRFEDDWCLEVCFIINNPNISVLSTYLRLHNYS